MLAMMCSWQAQVELDSHDGQLLFIRSSDSIQQGSEAVAEMFVQEFCICVQIVFAEYEVMHKITVAATMLPLRFASCTVCVYVMVTRSVLMVWQLVLYKL